MNFGERIEFGHNRGWISGIECGTHNGAPMTAEEIEEFEDGGDPCIPVIRPWLDIAEGVVEPPR